MPAGNKMQVPKEASRYHQEEFSFKGGSILVQLESINLFSLSPILRTRFLLRVVVYNIPRFYQILGEICLLLFCLRLLEIHKDLKTFWVYLKALLENYFKLSIIFLKNFFEIDQVSKYYFPFLFKPMQTSCKEYLLKCFYCLKG
jgi:hypothetical protein